MPNSDLSSKLITRFIIDMEFATDGTGATTASSGAIDTKNDLQVNLFAGITTTLPIDPNTYLISIGYSITESDTPGGTFTAVPPEKFEFRDSQSPIQQVYNGGGTPGEENFTLKEIGIKDNKRFLKISLTQSSSTSGDAQSADFTMFMVNNRTVQPI